MGLLVLEEAGYGQGSTNRYRINFDAGTFKPPYEGRDKLNEAQRLNLLTFLIEEYGTVCHYCAGRADTVKGPDGKAWHIDRIIPGIQGGRYEPDNIVLCCASCNQSKGPNKKRYDKMSPPNQRKMSQGSDKMTDGDDKMPQGGVKMSQGHDIQTAPDPSVKPSLNRPIEPSAEPSRNGGGGPLEAAEREDAAEYETLLHTLGLKGWQVDQLRERDIHLSAADIEAYRAFLRSSTANKPVAVLWAQHLKHGEIPREEIPPHETSPPAASSSSSIERYRRSGACPHNLSPVWGPDCRGEAVRIEEGGL